MAGHKCKISNPVEEVIVKSTPAPKAKKEPAKATKTPKASK